MPESEDLLTRGDIASRLFINIVTTFTPPGQLCITCKNSPIHDVTVHITALFGHSKSHVLAKACINCFVTKRLPSLSLEQLKWLAMTGGDIFNDITSVKYPRLGTITVRSMIEDHLKKRIREELHGK